MQKVQGINQCFSSVSICTPSVASLLPEGRLEQRMSKLLMIRGALVALVVAAAAPAARAASVEAAKKLYDQASPSLVAVKYTWESELGRRELIGAGIVVRDDGLVMSPLSVFDMRIPDEQMKEFTLIIAHEDRDAEELDAEFLGRDERTSVAFLKPKAEQSKPAAVASGESQSPSRSWKPIKFEESAVQ